MSRAVSWAVSVVGCLAGGWAVLHWIVLTAIADVGDGNVPVHRAYAELGAMLFELTRGVFP